MWECWLPLYFDSWPVLLKDIYPDTAHFCGSICNFRTTFQSRVHAVLHPVGWSLMLSLKESWEMTDKRHNIDYVFIPLLRAQSSRVRWDLVTVSNFMFCASKLGACLLFVCYLSKLDFFFFWMCRCSFCMNSTSRTKKEFDKGPWQLNFRVNIHNTIV